MKYSDVKLSIMEQYQQEREDRYRTTLFIMGQPGGGKSACARDALGEMGFSRERGNLIEFVASLRDPVDLLGTPDNRGDFTKWVPPEEFYELREGTGPKALLLEELSDASTSMFNGLCGVIHDNRVGNLFLTDKLIKIATGNRTEDKSGANRIPSKLAGRTRRLDYTENLEDFVAYALTMGDAFPQELIQFLRFRPGLLAEFDPNRFANPTPRTWEDVARINPSMPKHRFFENVKGAVGEGAAGEYVGFREIYSELPDTTSILLDPSHAKVPDNRAAQYAVMGAVARVTTKDNVHRVVEYTKRFDKEFDIMSMRDIVKLCPAVKSSRAFIEWASRNAEVMF